MLANRRIIPVLSLVLLGLAPSCISGPKLKAALWLNEPLPAEVCAHPLLKEWGAYRKLNDGRYEITPYCAKEWGDYFAIRRNDLETILRETLPKKDADKIMGVLNAYMAGK